MARAFILPDGTRREIPDYTETDLDNIFAPYGVALGKVVFNWNNLHERLADIFGILFIPPNERPIALNSSKFRMALSVWHSLPSDATQRAALTQALEHSDLQNAAKKHVLYVVNMINGSLRDQRNNAIHAPLSFTTTLFEGVVQTYIEPNVFSASPRVKSLMKKLNRINKISPAEAFLTELKCYGQSAELLATFSRSLFSHLSDPTIFPLPRKPSLPTLEKILSQKV